MLLLLFSCCQIAERVLSQELLWSHGGRSVSYLYYLAQLQLLRADYRSATASLKEALLHSNQVLALATVMSVVHCCYRCCLSAS